VLDFPSKSEPQIDCHGLMNLWALHQFQTLALDLASAMWPLMGLESEKDPKGGGYAPALSLRDTSRKCSGALGDPAPVSLAGRLSIMVKYRQGGCDGSVDGDGI
jgi:hypothetical protein